jgi:hypothetical protein
MESEKVGKIEEGNITNTQNNRKRIGMRPVRDG